MTDDEIQAEVQTLPFGPHGKASVAYLMRSEGLSLTDAVIKLENLVEQTDYSSVRRKNSTGVR